MAKTILAASGVALALAAPVVQAAEQDVPAVQSPAVAPPAAVPTVVEAPTAPSAPPAEAAPPVNPVPPVSPANQHEDSETITVSSRLPGAKIDPLRGVNEVSYKVVQAVDDNVVGPLAAGYEKTVPLPIRDGLHNALYNLREPFVAVNFALQLKPVKAVRTVVRFALNSTVGIAGLFDVARRKPFKMVRMSNSFANTLGYYGVGPGFYMYLPLLGPTTARDLVGRVADRMMLPLALGSGAVPTEAAVPIIVVGVLDRRLVNDERVEMLKNGKPDPYTATREDYLKRRKAEIEALHGKGPLPQIGSMD